ncbi:peptidase S8/S53 domain-containing protein [Globomyces pollinis-pini]|nr:peptidase S8/S53 domain-containing protein [Globomyces pollinis-pini]
MSFQEDSRNDQYYSSQGFWETFGIIHKYHLPEFKGYSVRIPSFIVNLLKVHQDIAFIEEDKIMTINGVQANSPAWGLRRIDERDLNINVKSYTFPDSAGTGVDAYIIDTGVFVGHPEFEGRARIGKSFSGDGTKDGNGHGTHCAGTIGSKTYGVAKNVSLIAVKVLDNQGSGTTSNVIAGIDWAAKDASAKAAKGGKIKAVANMSLGGGASAALDRAVKAATQAGLVFAVAAGNSARDACLLSPARVPEAITVAASDKYDQIASFSERGKCVDIIAPGVDILSTWNNGKTNTISGTSMATPHVCGVVALALAEGDFKSVKEVHDYIKAVSSKDKIGGSLRGAPNNFLYNNVLKGGFPDDEPKEPEPQPDEPEDPPTEGECPIPQCLFDPACTSCCVDCFYSVGKLL